jgi:hypothetical protein
LYKHTTALYQGLPPAQSYEVDNSKPADHPASVNNSTFNIIHLANILLNDAQNTQHTYANNIYLSMITALYYYQTKQSMNSCIKTANVNAYCQTYLALHGTELK